MLENVMSSSSPVSGVLATFPGINGSAPAPKTTTPSPAPTGLAAWQIFAIIFAIIMIIVFGLFFFMKPRSRVG